MDLSGDALNVLFDHIIVFRTEHNGVASIVISPGWHTKAHVVTINDACSGKDGNAPTDSKKKRYFEMCRKITDRRLQYDIETNTLREFKNVSDDALPPMPLPQ